MTVLDVMGVTALILIVIYLMGYLFTIYWIIRDEINDGSPITLGDLIKACIFSLVWPFLVTLLWDEFIDMITDSVIAIKVQDICRKVWEFKVINR